MGELLILRPDLNSDPKVLRVAGRLGADVDLVMGKLVRLWCHCLLHAPGGLIGHGGASAVDAIAGMPGLALALAEVGWLELSLTGAEVLEYEKYLGAQGVRALVDRWVKEHPRPRGRASCPEDPAFADFWAEYPRPGKASRKKALESWRRVAPDEAERVRIMDALRTDKRSERWAREGGRYVPHASTWLNQERWKDERADAAERVAGPGRVPAPEGKYARLSAGQEAEPGAHAAAAAPAGQAARGRDGEPGLALGGAAPGGG